VPLALALLATAGCFPNPPQDDESHASFAREVIPVLLGRRAHGVDEVEAVADIAQLLGREAAVRMLMKDEAFVDHWSDMLVDMLQMQRSPDGGLAAQDGACWGPPTRPNPDPAIAQWVRDHGPTDAGAPSPAWNMTDLLRSAIALDDLSPVYRANLFTVSMRRAGGNGGTGELTDGLLRVYLNRDITCLRCHNPTLSASNKVDSGGNIVWRRLWTIPGHPEKALFGNYYDATSAVTRIRPIMRGDVRKPAAGGLGTRPWGMAEACATDTNTTQSANNGTTTHRGFQALGAGTANNPGAGFGSLDGGVNPKVSLWELEGSLRKGVNDLKNGYERFTAATPLLPPDQQMYCDAVQVFSSSCVGCHPPSGSLDLSADPAAELVNVNTASSPTSTNAKRVVPNSTATSELWRRVNAGAGDAFLMPLGGPALSAANKTKIQDWINAGAPSIDTASCNTSTIPDVHPDEAFAFLTAANIVDGIWLSTMGYRLTIDHGYSRNADQRDMLWNLTEYTFVPNNWSLKAVLVKVLSSNWYARRAPTISQRTTAYEMPPLLDPWVVADPTEVTDPAAHERANGQGELVNRYRVNTLLRKIAGTLAWKEPRRFPGGGYPSPLDRDLGQFLSPAVSGFTGVNFQSLLALESEAGLCSKTGRAAGVDDWIDKLVADITAHNSANPDAPVTLGEAWSLLKDRMIQDPTIERVLPSGLTGVAGAMTEEQALIALLNQGTSIPGGADLNTSSGALTENQLRGKLREGCGILVKTPEFMLTNVTPRGYSDNDMPDPPRLAVCMAGEPCGYAQTCNQWRSVLSSMGQFIACEDRSVRRAPLIIRPFPGRFTIATIQTPIFVQRRPPLNVVAPAIPAVAPPGLTTAQQSALTTVDALRYRVEQLCPGGICGFVARPDTQRCLTQPTAAVCRPLLPPCDPRREQSVDSCRDLPADIHDPGVLVLWGEGALVAEAAGVRVLRANTQQWLPLQTGAKLVIGDLLDVPLTATLLLRIGQDTFGVKGFGSAAVDNVRGHLIAVTGPSAERLLTTPTVTTALSPEALRRGVEAGQFESRAPAKADWTRIIGYGALPQSRLTLSKEEIARINKDFDRLHFGKGRGVTPGGIDLPGNVLRGVEHPEK
jgi:hypothetical protein